MYRMREIILGTATLSLMLATAPASADEAAFYKGKNVTVVIPSNAGGGWNTYGRLVARFMGPHIPGNPTLVPQNVPGAGGLVAANHLYNIAPRDGTVFGTVQHGVVFKPIFDPKQVRYDVKKFNWLGSVTAIPNLAVVNKNAPVKHVKELFEKELVVGATGGGTNHYMPSVINDVLGTKIKIITGYSTSAETLLAIARGEVHGIIGLGPDSLPAAQSAFDTNIIFQMGVVRHPNLADVPLIQEYARTADEKAVLDIAFASISIGRVFVAPPGLPPDRFATLRKAFEATLTDSKFLAAAEREQAEVRPISAENVIAIMDRVYAQPKPILDRAAKAMGLSGS